MNVDRDIRFEVIARLCPNTTGAELRSVCTEAGMFAIRARKKSISEKDFMDSVNKVRMEDGMNEVEAKWGRREGTVAAQIC
jgi:ATP-dependent 26S proteasome regulatory subunit